MAVPARSGSRQDNRRGNPGHVARSHAWLTALTPDGSKLAFSGNRPGEDHLWLKALPDGQELPLFLDDYIRGNPQWSPDGSRLAYIRLPQNSEESRIMV
jgi:Tol biopolymer transport system component